VQYSSLTDIDEVEPLSDRDHWVLTDLRDVLRKHGVTDQFGVWLLHRYFDLNREEVLGESTDPGRSCFHSYRSAINLRPKTDPS
jgi:hypothetical protein